MDTSKKYYEDKMREFNLYRRGRTLAQYCKDEAIDYNWILQAKRKYSGRTQSSDSEPDDANETDGVPSLIGLHFVDDSTDSEEKLPNSIPSQPWKVISVVMTDPQGNEITIKGGSPASLGALLTNIGSCHA